MIINGIGQITAKKSNHGSKDEPRTAVNLADDEQCCVLMAQGDKQAFKDLFKRYFNTIYSTILLYTKNPQDAEDIVQITFLKLWENKETLAHTGNIKGWLFITARNEFLSRFRKKRTEDKYRNYLLQIFAEEDDTPEDLLVIRQKETLLIDLLSHLSEKQRKVFLLSRRDNLSYDEIAIRMHISRETVKEHMSRALKSIRKYLLQNNNVLRGIAVIWSLYLGTFIFF